MRDIRQRRLSALAAAFALFFFVLAADTWHLTPALFGQQISVSTPIRQTPGTTTGPQLTIRPAPTQTANEQEWQDSAGAIVTWVDSAGLLHFPAAGGGISNLNGLTANTQFFIVCTAGLDFNIQDQVDTHSLCIPDASGTARGLVTPGAQTLGVNKTLGGDTLIDGNLLVNEDIEVDGSLSLTWGSCLTPSEAGVDKLCIDASGLLNISKAGGAFEPVVPQAIITNGLISGGAVAWAGNLNFVVSPATYGIAGTLYSSALTGITLNPADPADPRIDAIIVDDTGAVNFITGTPAASPALPSIDPTSQLLLTFVTIGAGATVPSNVSEEDVYLEDTEWPCSESSPIGTFNCASTNNPYAGTKDIEATAVGRNDYVQLTRASAIVLSNYNNLVFYIRSKAAWNTQRSLTIAAYLSGSFVGSAITLNNGAFGFNSSNTTSYQQIIIPTSAFGAVATMDRFRFTVAGGGTSTIGFYLDNILLQGGVVPQEPEQPYDIVFSVPGLPDAGRVFPVLTFTRPVNFGGNFAGSRGTVGTNPTAQQTYTISKNGSAVATIVVTTGGVVSFTSTGAAPVSFIGGDRLTITAPNPQDATLADAAFTLSGTR